MYLFFKLWKYDNAFTGDLENTEQDYCFYFQYSGRWVIEDPAVMYVGECFAYVLL